jgi:hypothetical protein
MADAPTEDAGHHPLSSLSYEARGLADILCGCRSIGQAANLLGDFQINSMGEVGHFGCVMIRPSPVCDMDLSV